jgi:hypothetical protein
LDKKLNHRGRRAHRARNGQRHKAQDAWEKAAPFSTSASSSGIFLFFTSGGYKSGKIFIPKMRK